MPRANVRSRCGAANSTESTRAVTGATPQITSKHRQEAEGLQNQPAKKRRTENLADTSEQLSLVPTSRVADPLYQTLTYYGAGCRLLDAFFDVSCETLARSLLGQVLVRRLPDGEILRCKIVETECYLGGEDKASQSYQGRMTKRNEPMFMRPGTSYVYFTYGMYHCFNISSQGDGAAVLLRAAEPLEGAETMHLHRQAHRKGNNEKVLKMHELCNGPSKLCMSLAIDRFTCNRQDLSQWDGMWLERGEDSSHTVVTSHRIGIDRVEAEWRFKPLRFYVFQNTSVSKKDKTAEEGLHP